MNLFKKRIGLARALLGTELVVFLPRKATKIAFQAVAQVVEPSALDGGDADRNLPAHTVIVAV